MIKIEKFNEQHIDGIVEVEQNCFSIPWSKTSFLGELKNPNAYYVIALEDERVVAFGGIWHIINEGHITNIAVHSDYRGQKIGTQILNALIEQAKELEMIGLTLEVRVSNTTAIEMYKKFGFVEEGVRKNYYENKEDALILWLNF